MKRYAFYPLALGAFVLPLNVRTTPWRYAGFYPYFPPGESRPGFKETFKHADCGRWKIEVSAVSETKRDQAGTHRRPLSASLT